MTDTRRQFKMEFDFPEDFGETEYINGLFGFAAQQVQEQTEHGRRTSGKLYDREGNQYGRWSAL